MLRSRVFCRLTLQKHCAANPTTCTCYMLHLFAHPVGSCFILSHTSTNTLLCLFAHTLIYTPASACKESSVDSLKMVDFAIRLVNSFLNLPDSEVFGGNSNYRTTVINPPRQKGFWATLYIVLKGNILGYCVLQCNYSLPNGKL